MKEKINQVLFNVTPQVRLRVIDRDDTDKIKKEKKKASRVSAPTKDPLAAFDTVISETPEESEQFLFGESKENAVERSESTPDDTSSEDLSQNL